MWLALKQNFLKKRGFDVHKKMPPSLMEEWEGFVEVHSHGKHAYYIRLLILFYLMCLRCPLLVCARVPLELIVRHEKFIMEQFLLDPELTAFVSDGVPATKIAFSIHATKACYEPDEAMRLLEDARIVRAEEEQDDYKVKMGEKFEDKKEGGEEDEDEWEGEWDGGEGGDGEEESGIEGIEEMQLS